ncbi:MULTISPECIES: ATP-binding protein [unclassified Lentimicrobium]|uniref:ATP-binding protein n=1 Tax=unclassified Lentimicrobium TaxID=2677434 RepID=UPI001552C736|nr:MULTISPECIES: ATP-binding protein [unclassified Lentimicrobium]NPD46837.1 response regulator [Lentimicrobium sp. S6]NPD85125.1 response regulator [Lentimicrobium sp. L6]
MKPSDHHTASRFWSKLTKSLSLIPRLDHFNIFVYLFDNEELIPVFSKQKNLIQVLISNDEFLYWLNIKTQESNEFHKPIFNDKYAGSIYTFENSIKAKIVFSEEDDRYHVLKDSRKSEKAIAIEMINLFLNEQFEKEKNQKIKYNNQLNNYYKTAFEQTNNPIALITSEGELFSFNHAWAEMHGFENNDLKTGNDIKIFHSEAQMKRSVLPSLEQAQLSGSYYGEVEHIDKNENEIRSLMSIVNIKNSQEESIGFLKVVLNYNKSESYDNRLVTILESVDFGIVIIDPETFKILELNTGAIRHIGSTKEEIVGKECHQFICPAEEGSCPIMDLKQSVNNSERILINARGESIPILKTARQVILGDKKVIIESFIDIRELKKAQAAAEESARLKTAFLSNISHEIRTPLNHILGFTSLVLEDADIPETYLGYLKIVKRSGNHLLKIIEDIVTISKIEAGHHAISESEFQLSHLLYGVFSKYQSELVRTKKQIRILFENALESEKCFIKADEMKVKQVVENLVSNAVKYTAHGYVSMACEIKEKQVHITIEDSGKGIPENQLPHIFESFRQVADNDRKISEGTGVGLTICKSLSNMMGGNILVESEEGKGSKFIFSFPHKLALGKDKPSMDEVTTPDLTGKTILIVEDEKINYLYLKTLLQATHAHVIWKQNGKEAVDYMNQGYKIDLIMMDMQMPEMDGYEATLRIRRMNPNVIIIALTANVMADDKEKCLNLGCNEYTTKPIQQDVLYWHIGHFLK